jgi:hypothetical protein
MLAFYPALEGRQGARNTGEIMSFSCVENVCEYSRALAGRFL